MGDGKPEEVDGDLIGWGVQDGGHVEMERTMLEEHLISLPARVIQTVIRLLLHVLPVWGSIL